MYRRAKGGAGDGVTSAGGAGDPAADGGPTDGEGVLPPAFRRPELPGSLDRLLDHRPVFRRRQHGYDRFQVDNYVSWAEGELDAARRQCDHLLDRYGACMAELTLVRRTPTGTVTGAVSQRLGEMLRLASEEADSVIASGVDEAERIIREARLEAEARRLKVMGIREAAIGAAKEIVERARADARRLLRDAAAQHEKAEAEATLRLAAVQTEVDDLRRQRDEARQSLHRLTAQIGQALDGVGAGEPTVLTERRPVGSTVH